MTSDQAALMAAGIDPAKVDHSVTTACNRYIPGWPLAKKIHERLLKNLSEGNFDPEPESITCSGPTVRFIGDPPPTIPINGIVDMVAIIKEHGSLQSVTFKAESLWRWIAKNVAEELEFDADLYEYLAETYRDDNGSKTEDTGLSSPPDAKSNARETALIEQVAVLTERLQQAKNEYTALKKRTFRHENPLFELVREVQERYWGDNFDLNDPDTYSKQNDIIEWLMKTSRCESQKEAEMIARMARPPGLRPATKRLPFLRTGK